jgi:hypothetical protein
VRVSVDDESGPDEERDAEGEEGVGGREESASDRAR